MTDRLLREPEVARMTGLGRTTRYEMERRGDFPRRRRLTSSAVAWLESEVLEWMRSRCAGPGSAPAAALQARGLE